LDGRVEQVVDLERLLWVAAGVLVLIFNMSPALTVTLIPVAVCGPEVPTVGVGMPSPEPTAAAIPVVGLRW